MIDAGAFAWAIPLAVLALPALLAVFFGAATAFARLMWSDGAGRLAALAAGIALAEWLRGFVLTGFPWNTIGYAAMPVPLAMQSSTVIGLLGVTALAVLVFSAPALLGTRQGVRIGMALAALLAAAHVGFGAYVLAKAPPTTRDDAPEGASIVRLVQPSIPQSAKWDESERQAILEKYLSLTALPGEGGATPDIVVWPETAVPYLVNQAPEVLGRIADVLSDGQQLLMGAVRIDDSAGPGETRYYNSILVIDDDGQIVAAADKVHLVPFGEYLPFAGWLEALGLSIIAEVPQSFSAASERRLLSIGENLLALPLICYEAIFPLDVAGSFERRPDLIVNVTNDAWYGATPGPYQHFRQAQLRAAEARLPMVRAANNGISAVTDGYGRIIDGLGLNAVGVVDVTLPAPAVPKWDGSDRRRNFWLLIVMLLAAAVVSRAGFGRR
jgi:apolipoprotein N-acyltransferase